MTPRVLRRLLAPLALAAAAGCTTSPVFGTGRLPPGSWGGDHVLLVVGDTVATLEFDCAAGRIPGPLAVTPDGRFTWDGTYVVGHGGPIRQDEVPDVRPASYSGATNGREMSLRVRVKDGSLPLLEFQLDRGRDARVFRCL